MTVDSPFGFAFKTRFAHGSTVALPLAGTFVTERVGTDAPAVAMVGSSGGTAGAVSVGRGMLVGISVGGKGVAEGIASCVCATMVNAAASAVCCTSAGFTVGTAGAPHALIRIASIAMTVKSIICFM